MNPVLVSSLNLIILLGILFYKVRKPASDFLMERHSSIRNDIQTIGEKLLEAQRKYDEFSEKLRAVDSEVRELKAQAQNDVALMKQRFTAEIQRLSQGAIADAKEAATAMTAEFKREIYTEWCSQVLSRAEDMIKERLTGEDRARMRAEFSRQMETIQ